MTTFERERAASLPSNLKYLVLETCYKTKLEPLFPKDRPIGRFFERSVTSAWNRKFGLPHSEALHREEPKSKRGTISSASVKVQNLRAFFNGI